MKSIVKLLQILGFWSQPYQNQSRAKPLAFTVLYTVTLLLPGIVYIVRQQPSFTILIRTAVESFSISNVILLIVSTIVHQPMLEKVYSNVRFAVETVSDALDGELQLSVNNMQSFTDRLFKFYIGFEMTVGLIYCLANPILTCIKYVHTGEVPPLHGVFEADFYIFDYTANFWLWLLIITISEVSMFGLLTSLVLINSLHWSLIHHVSGLFKVVRQKLSNLSTSLTEKSRMDELIDIIKLHGVIFRSARLLEEALNVYMLIQFGTCIIMMCMTLMVLILAISDRDLVIKMILMMSFILFHILVYSMLGSELISSSASVADAIYEVPWYQWSVAEQRKVLFVLGRSQRPTALTTGKFFNINRETFGMILRTTVSYFTVLMQMYGAK